VKSSITSKVEDEMGGECSMHRIYEKCVHFLVGKSETKTREGSIRMYRRKTGWEGVDWIRMAQDREQ